MCKEAIDQRAKQILATASVEVSKDDRPPLNRTSSPVATNLARRLAEAEFNLSGSSTELELRRQHIEELKLRERKSDQEISALQDKLKESGKKYKKVHESWLKMASQELDDHMLISKLQKKITAYETLPGEVWYLIVTGEKVNFTDEVIQDVFPTYEEAVESKRSYEQERDVDIPFSGTPHLIVAVLVGFGNLQPIWTDEFKCRVNKDQEFSPEWRNSMKPGQYFLDKPEVPKDTQFSKRRIRKLFLLDPEGVDE